MNRTPVRIAGHLCHASDESAQRLCLAARLSNNLYMRFNGVRTAGIAALAITISLLTPHLAQTQAVGPLTRPTKARSADVFVSGEIASVGATEIRLKKVGGTFATIHITGSTEFAEGMQALEPGAYIRVRAIQGFGGLLTALTIWTLEENSNDTRRLNRRQSRIEAEPPPQPTRPTEKRRPVTSGIDDPGPPILQRRAAGDVSPAQRRKPSELPAPELQTEQTPQAEATPQIEFTPQFEHYDDPILAKAHKIGANASRGQANFICRQAVQRFESRNLGRKWKEGDLIEAEVLLVGDEEHYQQITKNGNLRGGKMEDQGGAWSTGEYGSMLYNLFVTGHAFQAEKSGGAPDESGVAYEYKVARRKSGWSIYVDGADPYITAYDGRFWIDPESSHVTKIEMTATGLSDEFPLRAVVNSVSFATADIDGENYWLPITAQAESCVRHTAHCHRNDITFSDYRKFTAESSIFQTESEIDFGGEAVSPEAVPSEATDESLPQ